MPQPHRFPDVWMQLLEHCAADPTCQPKTVRSLARQLSKQRVQLQDRVAAQEQLMSDQQQRVLAQDQLIAEQQQQIAMQQQQIAGFQGQIAAQQQDTAGLQGQLQELHAAVRQLLSSRQQ